MPFEKGHKGKGGGRKKGSKARFKLIRYSPKVWSTSFKNNSYNIDEITHRLENNLPIDDLVDKLVNRYSKPNKKKDGNEGM
jgi:hypothetical protein